MLRSTALVVVFVVVCLPALASEPGQPLDCSDWVFHEPGLSCTVYSPLRALDDYSDFLRNGTNKVIDNNGDILVLRSTGDYYYDSVLELVRLSQTGESVVASISDRRQDPSCNEGGCGVDHVRATVGDCSVGGGDCRDTSPLWVHEVLSFDAVNGRLLVPLRDYCQQINGVQPCTYGNYEPGNWIAAIEGFAPLFEIFHSYTPRSGAITYHVPTMPEGFQYADYFDTYYGDLSTVGDWSQAQPRQCGYPATAPSAGDYLTVEDTLPTPAPGQGYYYVTAVNYQGQRRYGRQSNGGVLAGRDPEVLPACQ